jgi:hypothetical protein
LIPVLVLAEKYINLRENTVPGAVNVKKNMQSCSVADPNIYSFRISDPDPNIFHPGKKEG